MSNTSIIAGIVIFGLIVGASFGTANANRSEDHYNITKDPERVCSGGGDSQSCKYLIFTDKGTLENTDSLWHGKFNSSDVHGNIREGDSCEITSVGFRITWASMYKNAIKVECVHTNVEPAK